MSLFLRFCLRERLPPPLSQREIFPESPQTCGPERNQPLIFRAGGGSDFGFPTTQTGDVRAASPKHVTLRGAPRNWTDTEVCSFLEGQKWTDVRTTSKIKGVWHLMMSVPPKSELSPSCWRYELECEDKDPFMLLSGASRFKTQPTITPLRGPRRAQRAPRATH